IRVCRTTQVREDTLMKTTALSFASLLALSVGIAAPAHAQEEGEDAGAGARPAEIVVTAQFREQNLQDTPIAITAVNSEMLEARGQTDIQQVASQAPNVTLKPMSATNGNNSMIAFIRGVGQANYNFALEPGVGIYIDDVYFPTVAG